MPPERAGTHLAAADLAHCRRLLAAGSRSFAAAARLLPAEVRDAATVLYAFCRVADDRVDEDPHATTAAVDELARRLDGVYAGRPADDPVDRALSAVVATHLVPRPLLDALLEGLAWDAAGRRYETLDDLYAYAARVAGTVGAAMSLLLGGRGRDVLARACDLGVAMQLTNIARDVGEDARRGRLYLPLAWLAEAGIDADALLVAPAPSPPLAGVVARLLDTAEVLYARADAGIAALPRGRRLAIRAARLLYAEIGRRVARAGFDSVTRRAVVPGWRKLWLLGRALFGRAAATPGALAAAPLGPTGFLVAAGAGAAEAA